LQAEKEEVKPQMFFIVYDVDGNIMRKLSSPLKKGYNSITWDMGYLTSRGPKVPPGEYKVALDKNVGGVFTRLVEPQTFNVISLDNALGTPAYTANFNFLKDVNALNDQVTAARGKIKDMNTRLKNMKNILVKTPVEANVLIAKIEAIQKEIDAVTKVISGGFGAKSSVISRLRMALYTSYSAQADITGTQREQFNMAKTAFEGQKPTLDSLFDEKLPVLEKEFEDAGGVLFNNTPERGRFFEN